MASWLIFGSQLPFQASLSGLPNMSDALQGWQQTVVFGVVTKELIGSETVETVSDITFLGVVQPLKNTELLVKPEGLRSWKWQNVHSEVSLQLKLDDVIRYEGMQYRVMQLGDYSKYGYMNYHIMQDYTGAGPEVVTP